MDREPDPIMMLYIRAWRLGRRYGIGYGEWSAEHPWLARVLAAVLIVVVGAEYYLLFRS